MLASALHKLGEACASLAWAVLPEDVRARRRR
jgi:hypothetical protein